MAKLAEKTTKLADHQVSPQLSNRSHHHARDTINAMLHGPLSQSPTTFFTHHSSEDSSPIESIDSAPKPG